MKIYGNEKSGNCLKVKWTCDHLGLDYEWVELDIFAGAARGGDHKTRNPAGQVPTLELDGGKCLSQSNAIIRYLARGSDLIPSDPFDEAKMDEWLFWEQYSHEPYIAVLRSQMQFFGLAKEDRDLERVKKGEAALDLMEDALEGQEFLVDSGFSLADIALVAYTRVAAEGGFDLANRPNVRSWIGRVEERLGI